MMKALLASLMLVSTALAQDATVKVSWDANSEGDLAGYKVYYGQASGNYSQVVDLGNKTTVDVKNLTRGRTYYFAVTAYDQSGNESGFSTEVSIAIQEAADTQAPNPPSNVRVQISSGG